MDYIFSGYTTINDTICSGVELVLYNRTDHTVIDSVFSTSSGTFELTTSYYGYHYLIALSPILYNYNAIIYDWLHPKDI